MYDKYKTNINTAKKMNPKLIWFFPDKGENILSSIPASIFITTSFLLLLVANKLKEVL